MKRLILAGAIALAGMANTAHAVTTITFDAGGTAQPSGLTVIQSFDTLQSGTSIGTNAAVYAASQTGVTRPAFGSSGNFAAVSSNGSYSVSFAPTNTFSFVLGSGDTGNSLTLRYTDGTSQLLTGGQIFNDAVFDSGNTTSTETNGIVTYRVVSGPLLAGATFVSSGGVAFEFDSLAIATGSAPVPEPAAWLTLILGFGLVGGAMRYRRAAATATLA